MPERIQLSRRKGFRLPDGAVAVSRPSIYGNPFVVGKSIGSDSDLWPYLRDLPGVAGDPSRGPLYAPLTSLKITSAQLAVDLFSCWFIEQPHLMIRAFGELPGRDLACWCKLPKPGEPDICHAAWLVGMLNGEVADDPKCRKPKPHGSHGASGCADLAERAGIDTRRFTSDGN